MAPARLVTSHISRSVQFWCLPEFSSRAVICVHYCLGTTDTPTDRPAVGLHSLLSVSLIAGVIFEVRMLDCARDPRLPVPCSSGGAAGKSRDDAVTRNWSRYCVALYLLGRPQGKISLPRRCWPLPCPFP